MYSFYTRKPGMAHALYLKILLIMRLTTVIIIASLMQVSAASFGQRITLSRQNAPLKELLKEIRKQSGYDIFFEGKVTRDQRVSVKITEAGIEEALSSTLKGLDLTYVINDKIVTIKKKTEPSFLEKVQAYFAAIDVRGRVVDEKGAGIPGVTVSLKEGKQATITNSKGEFELRKIDEGAVLVISFIGYVSREITVKESLGDIVLEISTSKLDEVKVIAYGKTTERTSVGNVSTVTSKEIQQQPVSNPLAALIGRVPGLQITQQGGYFGQAINVQIQGQNSLHSNNEPFYVIDGVPFQSQPLVRVGGVTTGISPFSLIDPNTIESISVLKDADATAIYGTRAANGAILITTKKGASGPLTFNVNFQQGMNSVPNRLDLLNTQQYLEMRQEGLKNIGLTATDNPSAPSGTLYAPDLTIWSQTKNTDWQKTLFGNSSYYTDINPSVSGGNSTTQYLVGATFHRETGLFATTLSNRSAGLNFNLNTSSTNQKFKMSLSGKYLSNVNELPELDLFGLALNTAPNQPELLNPDGTLNWAPNRNGATTIRLSLHPLAALERKISSKNDMVSSSMNLSYDLASGLRLSSSLGYNAVYADNTFTSPLSQYAPERRATQQRYATYGTGKNTNWIVEPQLTYEKALSGGKLSVLAGSTIQQVSAKNAVVQGSGYGSDDLLESMSAASQLFPLGSDQSLYKYFALFGRINYDWQHKYLLSLNVRRDGSSRFGENNRYHAFGSAGLGWVFSEESFIKNTLPFISFGKLTASYGTTGNDGIGNGLYLAQYGAYNPEVSYQGGSGLVALNIANPYLQWEETRKLNLGGMLNFFEDRIAFTANYFRNRSSNQLVGYSLPSTAGFYSITENLPATVQNNGLEFTATTVNVKSGKRFQWSSSFNITLPHNKLIRYDNIEQSTDFGWLEIGQPVNRTRVWHYLGVNTQTGVYEFEGKDGTPTSTPDIDNAVYSYVENSPKFYGGFNNNIRFDRFTLDFTFSFTKKKGQNFNFGYAIAPGLTQAANQPSYVMNRWQKPGDVATIQKFIANGTLNAPFNAANLSDGAYQDASYIRLTNVSLSWSLPEKWLKPLLLRNLSVFANAQNLMTITNYEGVDPETTTLGLPPLRVVTAGIRAQF